MRSKLSSSSHTVTLFALTIWGLVSLTPALSYAQAPTSMSTDIVKQNENVVKKDQEGEPNIKVGGVLSVSRSRTLKDQDDGKLQEGNGFLINPNARLYDYSINARIEYAQDLKNSEASDWGDLSFSVGKAITKWKTRTGHQALLNLNLNSVVPVSKDSRLRQSLNGTLGLGGGFALAPISGDGITLGLGLSIFKAFHQFDTALDGRVNNSMGSNQSASLAYTFGNLSASVEFIHRVRISYQNVTKTSFIHGEELSYAFSDHVSVAVGLSLEGTTQKSTGENNIALSDDQNTNVYGSMTLNF